MKRPVRSLQRPKSKQWLQKQAAIAKAVGFKFRVKAGRSALSGKTEG